MKTNFQGLALHVAKKHAKSVGEYEKMMAFALDLIDQAEQRKELEFTGMKPTGAGFVPVYRTVYRMQK